PEPHEVLGEVLHADAPRAGRGRAVPEFGHDGTPFLIVAPEFRIYPGDRAFDAFRAGRNALNFVLDVLSLLGMAPDIVVEDLLAPIQAHGPTLLPKWPKTTVKPASIMALHLLAIRV